MVDLCSFTMDVNSCSFGSMLFDLLFVVCNYRRTSMTFTTKKTKKIIHYYSISYNYLSILCNFAVVNNKGSTGASAMITTGIMLK